MPTANAAQAVDDTGISVAITSANATVIHIENTLTGKLFVNFPQLHATDEWVMIPAGASRDYIAPHYVVTGLSGFLAKADTGVSGNFAWDANGKVG